MASPDSGLIRVIYVKSSIGYSRRQKETVRSLGLRRLGDSVIQASSPAVLGMVHAVRHLVRVEAVEAPEVTVHEVAGSRRKRP